MGNRGWKPEYGISDEGIAILGYVEALPRELRAAMLRDIRQHCKAKGYLSLHDDLTQLVAPRQKRQRKEKGGGKVLPFRRAGRS